MASYSLQWKPSAVRELRSLPAQTIARLIAAIEALRENPYPQGTRKLSGVQDTWRIRNGDYRVLYRIIGDIVTIEIIRIAHRRDVYQH